MESKTRNPIKEAQFEILSLALAIAIGSFTTFYMGVSSFAYFCLLLGFAQRKTNRKNHVALMTTTILLDLAVVLTLEVQRAAIDTAMSLELNFVQQAHIYCSTLAIILYIPAAYIGFMRYKNKLNGNKTLVAHRNLGYAIMIFRSLGFLLMFSLLEK